MVIGIIGKTQGVKIEANPKPNATARNPARLSDAAGALPGGGGGTASLNPAGMTTEEVAAGSILTVAVPAHLDGTHILGLQTWYLAATASSAGPAGASFLICTSTRKSTAPS